MRKIEKVEDWAQTLVSHYQSPVRLLFRPRHHLQIRVLGDEIRWKFVSDSSVNGWGWAFTVYPVTPSSSPIDLVNDRSVLSRPSIDLVTCLLSATLHISRNSPAISLRLAAALASCAQLGALAPPGL